MDIEQIIRETKIVPTSDAIRILANYEHPNGLSIHSIRKLLFGYKEGLCNSTAIKQTLRNAITYAEHAIHQIPENPERNTGIMRGQISHYLSLFYERSTIKGNENLVNAYEHSTNSINDAITYRDWGAIDERFQTRKKFIENLKQTDSLTWLLRGANDSNRLAVELNKTGFPHKNITGKILTFASKLYQEASHEFDDKADAAKIVHIAYECAQNAIPFAEPKEINEKTMRMADIANALFAMTRENRYWRAAINTYEELRRGVNKEVANQATKKLKELNKKS